MGIYRYTASADNTITNAFRSNLTGRGTGSNMGAADVLEAFYIAGQTSSSSGLSSEKSRILIKFDLDGISSDRSAGTIPASGSVSWYLRMYNAAHASTLPKGFKMAAKVVSGSWQEGTGLDMDEYTDQTYGVIPGSNWITKGLGADGFSTWLSEGGDFAESGLSPAVSSPTFVDGTEDISIDVSDMVEDWVTGGVSATCSVVFNAGATSTNLDTLGFRVVDSQGTIRDFTFDKDVATSGETIGLSGLASVEAIRDKVVESINNVPILRVTAVAISDLGGLKAFSVTMDDIGLAGNKTGGIGDFEDSGSLDGTQYLTVNNENFQNGTGIPNYGFGVMLSGSYETGSQTYYTKKVFSRSSEYFFKRPVLEARWDSSKKDSAATFYLSSALAPSDDNVNTLYMYNYIKGQLTDIPGLTNNIIDVSLYSGSALNTTPAGNALPLPPGAGVASDGNFVAVGGKTSLGIYTASLIYPPESSSVTTVFPVWNKGGTQYHTGSAIDVITFDASNISPNPSFVSKITNLKSLYAKQETARFRLYVRDKNWNPVIYTVASTEIQNSIVENAYYKIFRIVDDLEVIPYGTGSAVAPQGSGSAGSYTRLSYDISGNYFDLNMDLLEEGYAYGVKLAYYSSGRYEEQPEVFKFRVEA
jgi:hypothetical protein